MDSKMVLLGMLEAIASEKDQRSTEGVIVKSELMECTRLTRRNRCHRATITWLLIDFLVLHAV
jgi:hypothetical protein